MPVGRTDPPHGHHGRRNGLHTLRWSSRPPRVRAEAVRLRCRTLNSGVLQGVTQGVPQGEIDTKNLDLIRGNNKLSVEAIAQKLSVSSKTVWRHLEKKPNVNDIASVREPGVSDSEIPRPAGNRTAQYA